jgi:hypothetical protein
MKTSLIVATLLAAAPAFSDQPISTRKPIVVAGLCVKIGEETSGAYKSCRYNCPGGLYEMEIKPSERCPASIDH